MFRISKDEQRSRTVVIVDGQLSGDAVDVLETCCAQELRRGKPVRLLLRDLATIDESGRTLLSRLAAKGVDLGACGVYTSYVVRAIHDMCREKARTSRPVKA